MPKSRYHVLFIVSLAIDSLIGSQLEVEKHFNSTIERGLHSSSTIATGLSAGIISKKRSFNLNMISIMKIRIFVIIQANLAFA